MSSRCIDCLVVFALAFSVQIGMVAAVGASEPVDPFLRYAQFALMATKDKQRWSHRTRGAKDSVNPAGDVTVKECKLAQTGEKYSRAAGEKGVGENGDMDWEYKPLPGKTTYNFIECETSDGGELHIKIRHEKHWTNFEVTKADLSDKAHKKTRSLLMPNNEGLDGPGKIPLLLSYKDFSSCIGSKVETHADVMNVGRALWRMMPWKCEDSAGPEGAQDGGQTKAAQDGDQTKAAQDGDQTKQGAEDAMAMSLKGQEPEKTVGGGLSGGLVLLFVLVIVAAGGIFVLWQRRTKRPPALSGGLNR